MVCYKAGRETGAWYELKCIRAVITNKEARGESATFERELYKAWLKHPEFAKAEKENLDRGLYKPLVVVGDKREQGLKPIPNGITRGTIKPTGVMQHRNSGGRPRKTGKVHRTTAWRRKRVELQGALL